MAAEVDVEKQGYPKRPDTPEDGLDPTIDNELNMQERQFLLQAERGDLAAVRKFIIETKKNKSIDINCTDHLGRTALVIAICNENMDLIQMLLNSGADPGDGYGSKITAIAMHLIFPDSLLHAVSEDYVEGVEYLLAWEEMTHKPGEAYSWETIDEKVATYNPEITPLILAAHRNNYEILSILLNRGATLPLPHEVKCGCDECVESQKEDGLRHSRSRITSYQAMSCPSLICLASRDPVLSAFELSSELRKLTSIDTEFKTEYVKMRKAVQHFTESLLDHTRKSYELEIMLNYDPEGKAYQHGERMELERLKLAIQHQQKEFVAHANVQQLLATVWYDGMPGFRRKSMVGQLTEVAKIAASFPVYSFMYIMAPHSIWGQRCRKPFIKFIIHSSSYLFFLSLLVMVSQHVESIAIRLFGNKWLNEWQDERERKSRGAFPNFAETAVIIYVMGFLWAEIRQLWDSGLKGYFEDMWNIVDFGANWFFVNWILLRTTAFIIVWREQVYGIDPWQPKEKWHPYDPMFISEGMYGAANIISFLKLIHIVSVSEHLGPLQISLGRMVFDIIKFMCIVMLVVFSFGCGLNQMLWYYAEMDKNLCYSGPGGTMNDDYENSCQIWRRFSNLFETSQSLFWAVFGLVDIENFELTGIQEFTRFWTLLMFGSYSAINIVVLLNLLIAMMSNSYNIIFERSDLEWKFSRSKLWISYFDDGSTLPPPFNIIPSPKSFFRLMRGRPIVRCNTILRNDAKKRDKQYFSVMRSVVKRYICHEQRNVDETGVTEDDINEVKQDINTFKFQLFDILKKNGMKSIVHDADAGAGRKQVQKERRLMKGFNIGLVENSEYALNQSASTAATMFTDMLNKGKKGSKKHDWNTIVKESVRRRDHIGSSQASFDNERRRSHRLSKRRQKFDQQLANNPMPRPRWKKVQYMKERGVFQDGTLNQSMVDRLLNTERRLSTGWGRVQAMQLRGAFMGPVVDNKDTILEEDEKTTDPSNKPGGATETAPDVDKLNESNQVDSTTTTTGAAQQKPAADSKTAAQSTATQLQPATTNISRRSSEPTPADRTDAESQPQERPTVEDEPTKGIPTTHETAKNDVTEEKTESSSTSENKPTEPNETDLAATEAPSTADSQETKTQTGSPKTSITEKESKERETSSKEDDQRDKPNAQTTERRKSNVSTDNQRTGSSPIPSIASETSPQAAEKKPKPEQARKTSLLPPPPVSARRTSIGYSKQQKDGWL